MIINKESHMLMNKKGHVQRPCSIIRNVPLAGVIERFRRYLVGTVLVQRSAMRHLILGGKSAAHERASRLYALQVRNAYHYMRISIVRNITMKTLLHFLSELTAVID